MKCTIQITDNDGNVINTVETERFCAIVKFEDANNVTQTGFVHSGIVVDEIIGAMEVRKEMLKAQQLGAMSALTTPQPQVESVQASPAKPNKRVRSAK